MPTPTVWHDVINGNDNYAGTDSLLRASGTDLVTNGTTTATSASGLFTSGMTGMTINILTKARYTITYVSATTITLSGSPASGTGLTWYIGGAFKSLAVAGAFSSSVLIGLIKSPDPVAILDTAGTALNATFTNKSQTITLSGSVGATKDISTCDATTSWTAGTNTGTMAANASRKQGTNSLYMVTNSGLSNAIIAYYATGSAIDLSLYQKISLWIKVVVAIPAGVVQIRLCSDTVGATPIVTFSMDAIAANVWHKCTFDNGSALPSVVNSISLFYATTGGLTRYWYFDNIFASVASGPTLTTLIGKDSSPTSFPDNKWPVQSVVTSAGVTTITLDAGVNTDASAGGRGYSGTTETVAIYAQEPSRCVAQSYPSVGSPITYSGGWNPTTQLQDGFTWLDLGDSSAIVWGGAYNPYAILWTVSNFGTCSGSTGISFIYNSFTFPGLIAAINAGGGGISFGGGGSVNVLAGTFMCIGNSTNGLAIGCTGGAWSNSATIIVRSNGSNGLNVGSNAAGHTFGGTVTCSNNGLYGIAPSGAASLHLTGTVTCSDNGSVGVNATNGATCYITSLATSGNTSSSVMASSGGVLMIGSFTPSESTAVYMPLDYSGALISCQKFNGTVGDSRTWRDNGIIKTDTTTYNTASPSWNLQPNANAIAAYPLTFGDLLDMSAAVDTTATTPNIHMRFDNSAVVQSFTIMGGMTVGIPSDVSVSATGSINTWANYTTASVTATDDNSALFVKFTAHAAGATGKNAWFDDIFN